MRRSTLILVAVAAISLGACDQPARVDKSTADRLSGRGFSDADLKKILGDNFMRVYTQILG